VAFYPQLKLGDKISNDDLGNLFKCGNSGGMRRSNTTNTLVIVSDHTKGLYEDRWDGDTLHYTGMGPSGDQDIFYSQNRTLSESNANGVSVFLFEVFNKNEYIYGGQVRLVGAPYQENQPDIQGVLRKVWMFPVALVDSKKPLPVEEAVYKDVLEEKIKEAKRLSDEQVLLRAKAGNGKSGKRSTTRNEFSRNAYVIEFAKRRSNGVCELCEQPAPFKTKKGEPFLEVHHIEWLANGGLDTIENTVALCPNCHRRMHLLNSIDDRAKLSLKASRT
jgi:5-methylcytosine-specific restriction protein A